jgi:hypothetical protein
MKPRLQDKRILIVEDKFVVGELSALMLFCRFPGPPKPGGGPDRSPRHEGQDACFAMITALPQICIQTSREPDEKHLRLPSALGLRVMSEHNSTERGQWRIDLGRSRCLLLRHHGRMVLVFPVG